MKACVIKVDEHVWIQTLTVSGLASQIPTKKDTLSRRGEVTQDGGDERKWVGSTMNHSISSTAEQCEFRTLIVIEVVTETPSAVPSTSSWMDKTNGGPCASREAPDENRHHS